MLKLGAHTHALCLFLCKSFFKQSTTTATTTLVAREQKKGGGRARDLNAPRYPSAARKKYYVV
jgi:hypothetical protein